MGSFVEMWVNLETVIQSEVSQKNKYHILTHIRGIQKNSRQTYWQRRNRDKDIEDKCMDTKQRSWGQGQDELGD